MANNILSLSKKFKFKKRTPSLFGISIYESKVIRLEDIKNLKLSLINVQQFWSNVDILNGDCLISVYSKTIIAKSNRIKELFRFKGCHINQLIVGARFGNKDDYSYHIFTYLLNRNKISDCIDKLNELEKDFKNLFGDSVSKKDLEAFKNDKSIVFNSSYYSKNQFIQLICELSYINRFDTYFCDEEINDTAIITLFQVKEEIISLLHKVGIVITNDRVNENTVLLFPDEYSKIKNNAPYLISMAVSDFGLVKLPNFNKNNLDIEELEIKDPSNEPVIGVIDTLFDKNVYFEKWVEYIPMVSDKITPSIEDFQHGTAVSSLIVDLPQINPKLDDGCGNFRVRHFGVTFKGGGVTSFQLMKKIETIIENNRDIHVWNLSLGSKREINSSFISPEASILDKLQYKYNDIIFVVSGTNAEEGKPSGFIGAPADSINSIVVNSVRLSDKNPASYSRKGPALSFFVKPDISYYGGDYDEPINVCYPFIVKESWGTSFAAPLIARKMAYLIDVLKISRECAKALLIDSAIKWNREFNLEKSNYIGRGIVPININDIISSNNEEIRFYIDGFSNKYCTYEYDLPVPLNNKDEYPYIARATLCYFPRCSRNQGVDYTDTELNVKFGRIKDVKGSIESINKDYQDQDGHFTKEKQARMFFRKWDNIKILSELEKKGNRPKKKFFRDNWGINLTYTERDDADAEKLGVKWGIVITLKAIDGKNRIEEFIQRCVLNDWRVRQIEVNNMVKVYNQSQVDVEFDD